MTTEQIKETPIWHLYEKGRNYHRLTHIYTDTDRNYRFYNGNQWDGAKLGGIEPVQKNFIKPIVKYKVSVIHDNLYAINYSSQNFTNKEFMRVADRYCAMLNRYAHKVWEQDKMDFKGRRLTKDAAINDEGILYISFDLEKMKPVNEIIKKNDVYYGNENDDDIQSQPYILLRKRLPVSNAIELALSLGMSVENRVFIIGDNDTFEESGEAAKEELDNMVTLIYKLYKKDGTVHFSVASRWIDIVEDEDIGISLYPVAHFNWEEKEGSARGEGEVRCLIPNQIEVNKTEMRRVLTVKNQAYPYKVVDVSKVSNPHALKTVGSTIETKGQAVDDVHKIVGTIQPAQMSSDVKQLQDDLIQTSRDLAGAGDVATGQVDPESASGRAILAVQQASQAPMTEQRETYKNFVEDVAKIWLEYLIAYSYDGIDLEEEVSEIVAFIKSNKSLIDSITTSKVNVTDIVNNLTTNVNNKPLSAAQGVVLKALIDAITVPTKVSQLENDKGYLTQHQSLDGYAKKTDIPTVPTKVSAFENDKGYLMQHQDLSAYAKKSEVPTVPTKVSQLENDKGYLTQHQSLDGYAKKTDIPTVPTKLSQLSNDEAFLTQTEIEALIESIVLNGYLGGYRLRVANDSGKTGYITVKKG